MSGMNHWTQKIYTCHTDTYSHRRRKTFIKTSCNSRTLISGHHIHLGINIWIHQLHHHHNDQWKTLDRLCKKYGSIGHSYTILTTTPIITSETRKSTLLKETGGGGTISWAQDMTSLGHKQSLSEDIYTRRETNSLDYWHKRGISFNKINTDTLSSLIGNLNHAAHIIPTERYFLNGIHHLLTRGKNGDHNGSNYGIN